jgi:hypothetical protein
MPLGIGTDVIASHLTVGIVTKFRDDLRAHGGVNVARNVEVISTSADDNRQVVSPPRA